MRAGTRSAPTSSASSTPRSSAIGCGCARRCEGRLGCRRRGVAHRHRRPGAAASTDGTDDDVIVADVLVLACGRLTEPSIPGSPASRPSPGRCSTRPAGITPPTSRAPASRSSARARARCSSCPSWRGTAAHVTLFQRTPAWIVPRGGDAYSDADRARFAATPRLSRRCAPTCTPRARRASRRDPATPMPRPRRRPSRWRTSSAQVSDPALRAALTPDYAFGCKRVLLSDDFYPAVASGAVTLERAAPSPPSRARRSSPRTARATRSTRSCSRPDSPRPVSRTPSSSRARTA